MAINETIRENLPTGSIILDDYAYDNSIIGVSTDGRVVYSYSKMIKELMDDEGLSEIDAVDWIDYNTVRAIPYFGEKAPIICEDLLI